MENQSKRKRNYIIMLVALFLGIVSLGLGVTFAFFNYTRTGVANTLSVGRMNFTQRQTKTINLSNVIPISQSALGTDTDNVGEFEVEITGDTDYVDGIEYVISSVNATVTTSTDKVVPLSFDVTVTNLGNSSDNYFTARNSKNATIYKKMVGEELVGNQMLLVGYIKPNTTTGTGEGVNGKVTIKAYFDADKIAITDTYDEETNLQNNGTTNAWVNNRVVLTTSEWNSLSSNGLSFQVNVVAQEGIWAEEPISAFEKITRDVITGTTIDFANESSASNGQGLYQLNEASGNNYPIYYYRGAVTDNNVIFGGYCWQIVRTTETGGIKMVYNGVATGDGKTCENTTAASRQLPTQSAFKIGYNSLSDVGYMYNQRYEVTSQAAATDAYFGNGVEYNGESYTLTGIYTDNENQVKATKDATHHYTCNSASSYECPSVRYYYFNNYYITLSGGEKVEDALYKMTGNGTAEVKAREVNQNYKLNNTDSNAKNEIEKWFKTNLTNEEDNTKINYQEYLEDTIFCNDRSYKTVTGNTSYQIYTQSGWNPNGGDLTKSLYFGTYNRYYNNYYSTTNKPELSCTNVTDQFSKSNPEATLKYSVGLLTVDEIILAGATGGDEKLPSNNYLNTGGIYWSSSPNAFGAGTAMGFLVGSSYLSSYFVTYPGGLRPVVSLKLGTEFESGGNGSTTKPYVVKYN